MIVAADPEGRSRGSRRRDSTDVPVVTVRPLGRGPARALARAGFVQRDPSAGFCSDAGGVRMNRHRSHRNAAEPERGAAQWSRIPALRRDR